MASANLLNLGGITTPPKAKKGQIDIQLKRLKEGKCPICGSTTHEQSRKNLMGQPTGAYDKPLTIDDLVRNGKCLDPGCVFLQQNNSPSLQGIGDEIAAQPSSGPTELQLGQQAVVESHDDRASRPALVLAPRHDSRIPGEFSGTSTPTGTTTPIGAAYNQGYNYYNSQSQGLPLLPVIDARSASGLHGPGTQLSPSASLNPSTVTPPTAQGPSPSIFSNHQTKAFFAKQAIERAQHILLGQLHDERIRSLVGKELNDARHLLDQIGHASGHTASDYSVPTQDGPVNSLFQQQSGQNNVAGMRMDECDMVVAATYDGSGPRSNASSLGMIQVLHMQQQRREVVTSSRETTTAVSNEERMIVEGHNTTR